MHQKLTSSILIVWVVLQAHFCAGAPRTWQTAGAGDWSDSANWGGTVPQPGDDVVIDLSGAAVTLDADTAALASLTISNNASLIFENWTTTLEATTVTVGAQGTLTCAGPFDNAPAVSNRVNISCTDLIVADSGAIDVSGKGYKVRGTGGDGWDGAGPGGGSGVWNTYDPSGGGHGGRGGSGAYYTPEQGNPYGVPSAPVMPGSGGGSGSYAGDGTAGGGAIRIAATGQVTIDGALRADGLSSSNRGGKGSGGSIYITCNTVSAANGTVSARGGSKTSGTNNTGTGGGGRIAIVSTAPAQAGSTLTLTVASGSKVGTTREYRRGGMGSIYLSDASLLASDLSNIEGRLESPSSISADSLDLDDRWVGFADGVEATIAGDVTIDGVVSRLVVGGSRFQWVSGIYYDRGIYSAPVMHIGGDLLLTNGASLYAYSSPTNGQPVDYGAFIDVNGDVLLAPGARVYPYSHPTDGGSPKFDMANLLAATNVIISAYAKGFGRAWGNGNVGWGPGGGYRTGGAGHGGKGGDASNIGGGAYGSSNAPVAAGSGGGSNNSQSYTRGGLGGGVVRLTVGETANLQNGATLSASGGSGASDTSSSTDRRSGGGAGGSIYLYCHTLIGEAGVKLIANGGRANNYEGGGGGGGRIAIWRATEQLSGSMTLTVSGGTGRAGNADNPANDGVEGSIVWGLIPPSGTTILIQ